MSLERRNTDEHQASRQFLSLTTGMLFYVPLVLLGSEVGTALRFPGFGSAILFPPYALVTAALVASKRRHWIWYLAVAVVAHALTSLQHWTVSWVLFSDVGNIARVLVAAGLIRWLFGGPPRLDSVAELLQFVASAVIAAPAVGATIGAANVVWQGASVSYWRPWLVWFVSGGLTALVMLPGLFAATRQSIARQPVRLYTHCIVEASILGTLLAATCAAAFFLRLEWPGDLTLLLYAPLPLLIWAALRFGHGGASLALTAVAVAAVVGLDRGIGPFQAVSADDNVLSLQVFMFLTAVPVLCIAAIGSGRRGAVQLYRALLASVHDHVAILDARGVVLEVSRSWEEFANSGLDCPLDQSRAGDDYLEACRAAIAWRRGLGTPDEDIVAAQALKGVQRVLQGNGRRFEMEYEQPTDGPHEWFTLRFEALERADGGVVVTRANVTARHRAQLEIEEQRREVTHLARVGVLGQLSGALAHELRQPLSSILANAEAARHVLRREPIDRDELGSILQDIASEDRRAAQVIDGLRSMLKRGEARVQPLDTAALVADVLALARAELMTRGVTAATVVEPGLPPVLADRVQVQQVLLNLILNACEAMTGTAASERSLLLTASIVGTSDVRFSVQDFGTGIPPVLIDRLFEPFVTTKPEGLGLGLSIARSIVAAHGGRIWAENNATRGATIHCVFASTTMSNGSPEPRVLAGASIS